MPKANAAGISNRKKKTARQLLRTNGREKSFFRKCLAEDVDQDTSSNGRTENPSNFLLMHAMGPNVAGVIGSAVAAGILINIFG